MSGAARSHPRPFVASPSLDGPDPAHHARLVDRSRLEALARTGLLDGVAEEAFDRFTRMATQLLRVPTALMSLVDDRRQFFKSAVGLGEPWASRRGTPLSHSFCQYAVSSAEPLVVADARSHPWLHRHLATTELGVVAYAGVPLITSEAQVLGALCVLQPEPREWTESEVATLRDLAAMTMTEIELRHQLASGDALRAERGQERKLLYAILDSIDDAILVTRRDGTVMLANPAARRLRTPELADARNSPSSPLLFETDGHTPVPADRAPSSRALAGEDVRSAELLVRLLSGDELYQSVHATPLRDEAGKVFAAVSVGRDVTAARRAQATLTRSEAILRAVVRHLPNGAVLLFDHDLRYLMADGEQLLTGVGLRREDLVGRTLREVSNPQTLDSVERIYRAALGGETTSVEFPRADKVFAVTTVPVRDESGAVTAGLALVYDVTAHKRAEATVRHEAETIRSQSLRDELTGLYNRRGFLELSRQQLSLASRTARPALLFFVDLNGMKTINDRHGHEQGDQALAETAEILRATFRTTDVLARLGGDEFVALLMDADESQQGSFEARVKDEVDLRNARAGQVFELSLSIGSAAFDPAAPLTLDGLLAHADAQMYQRKRESKAGR